MNRCIYITNAAGFGTTTKRVLVRDVYYFVPCKIMTSSACIIVLCLRGDPLKHTVSICGRVCYDDLKLLEKTSNKYTFTQHLKGQSPVVSMHNQFFDK